MEVVEIDSGDELKAQDPRLAGALRGLEPKNVLTPAPTYGAGAPMPDGGTDVEEPASASVSRRATRASRNGRAQVNYSAKFHPMDVVTRPKRASRILGMSLFERSQRGRSTEHNDDFDGEDEPSSIVGDSGEESSPEYGPEPVRAGLKRPEADPKAIRRSKRSEAAKPVNYNRKIHPQDYDLPGYRKRLPREKLANKEKDKAKARRPVRAVPRGFESDDDDDDDEKEDEDGENRGDDNDEVAHSHSGKEIEPEDAGRDKTRVPSARKLPDSALEEDYLVFPNSDDVLLAEFSALPFASSAEAVQSGLDLAATVLGNHEYTESNASHHVSTVQDRFQCGLHEPHDLMGTNNVNAFQPSDSHFHGFEASDLDSMEHDPLEDLDMLDAVFPDIPSALWLTRKGMAGTPPAASKKASGAISNPHEAEENKENVGTA